MGMWSAIAALAAALAVAAAEAEDGSASAGYRIVTASKDQIVLIDPAQVETPAEGRRRFWAVAIRRTAPFPGLENGGVVKSLLEIDCAKRQTRWISSAIYDRDYRVQTSKENSRPTWANIAPDTSAEGQLEFVCGPAGARLAEQSYPRLGGKPLGEIVAAIFEGAWPYE